MRAIPQRVSPAFTVYVRVELPVLAADVVPDVFLVEALLPEAFLGEEAEAALLVDAPGTRKRCPILKALPVRPFALRMESADTPQARESP